MKDVNETLKEAIHQHQTGNLADAEILYNKVLDAAPGHPLALHSLGIVAHQQGRNDIAADRIAKAISANSMIPQFHNTQGLVMEALGRIEQAIASYEKAISLNSDFAQAHLNLAIALQAKGDFSAAVKKCKQISLLFGDSPKVSNLMGYSLQKQGLLDEAMTCFRKAVDMAPDYAETYNHIGVILNDQEKYDEAADACQRAVQLDPEYAEAYSNLAVALNGRERYTEAIDSYKKAIQLNPNYGDAWYNMANCLRNQNLCDQSIEIYRKAIQVDPNNAKAHWNLSHALLQTGQFSEGWKEYAWRHNPQLNILTYPHTFDQPYWDGSSFAGKRMLVHYEQGFGDNIQFARYLPMLKQRGGTVIMEVRKPLYGLLKQLPGVDEFVRATADGKAPDLRFDLHTSPLELPRIFGTTLDNIPCDIPYLHAEPEKVEYWRNRVDNDSLKVGIVWAGSHLHGNDHNRSCSLKHFAPLAKIDGLKLYSLQKDCSAGRLDELADDITVIDLGIEFEDFTDTAAAIENMDLVISVDTSVLHLAGAMGKDVWALIPFQPEWRWMLQRQDSPWYPTMKIFRQTKPRDWDELFNRVALRIGSILANRT